MTPVLFPADAKTYTTQGLGALSDVISCTVREERNGEYELEMQYPQTGLHFSEIADRCIILAIPSPWRTAQPFRIYRITKPLGGVCTIYARHITYDLSGIPVNVFSAQSAAGALSGLKTNSATANPFEFWTDKQTSAAFAVSVPASIRSLLGGSTGSVLDVYGGEYEWDGWTVRLHEHRGTDRGVTIRYGKNLTDIEQDRNIANVRTGLYPYWADNDGNLVVCDPPIVNAPGSYDFVNVQAVDFSQEWQEAPTPEQLKARAEQYIQANEIGVPTVSISVSFVDLSRTDQYKDLALLEQCDLCDTVTVQFEALGIDATAEVVSIETNVLLERYDKIEVGSLRTNIADTIVDNQQRTDEQIKQTTSYLEDRIQQSTDLITNGGGYIFRKFDANKNWVEIGSTDNLDLQKAVKVWRWNNGGFGFSGTGYNGPYHTAITQDGHIVADFIDAGTLTANIMRAGVLQDVEGKAFYLDLPNGVLRMNATELSINSSAVATQDYADNSSSIAKGEAIQEAVSQAENAFGESLKLYPTKIEMNSAINQSAGEISTQVSMRLEGYSTKEYTDTAEQAAKDFASGAAQDALDAANAATDSKLALYPTTIDMNSAITQTASQIKSEVSQTLTQYSTTEESEAYAAQMAGAAEDAANTSTDNKLKNYSTTVQMNSAIDQKANSIILEVGQTYATKDSLSGYTKTSEVRSQFAMDPTSVTISSGQITFNSNSLVINSTNFSLDSQGNVSANGDFSSGDTQNGASVTIKDGIFRVLKNGTEVVGLASSAQRLDGLINIQSDGSLIMQMAAVDSGAMMLMYSSDRNCVSQFAYIHDGYNNCFRLHSQRRIAFDSTDAVIVECPFVPYLGKTPMYLDWVYMNGNWVLAGFNSPH